MKPGPRPADPRLAGRPEVIGFVDQRELARGLVRGLANACRVGVPVELRAGVRAYEGETGPHLVDEAAGARVRLQADIDANQRRRDNALKAIDTAHSESIVTQLVGVAERAEVAVVRLTRQLAELADVEHLASGAAAFDASTDILLEAMRRLLHTPRLTRQEHDSFRRVVSSLRLRPIADGWQVEAYVRVLVADGLAVLGPISWHVTRDRVGVGAMRLAVRGSAQPEHESVAKIESRLVREAKVTKLAAHVLIGAPFPELAQLVLHDRTGTPLPEWVSAEWREPAFVRHVVSVYTNPGFEWSRSYGRLSITGQALIDCTAAHGRLTLADFREMYPGGMASDLWRITEESYRDDRSFARRAPLRLGRDADGARCLELVTCRCGLPATTLVRGPEIPGDLLCTCGLAAHAAPGTSAWQVVFPEAYQRLRVGAATGTQAMRRRFGRRGDELTSLTPKEKVVLASMVTQPRKHWSIDEVATACKIPHKSAALNLGRLSRRDFVTSDPEAEWFVIVDVEDAQTVLTRRSPRGE